MTEAASTFEVWQDEDCIAYYAEGHQDPDAFLDAIAADEIKNGNVLMAEVAEQGIRAYTKPSDVQHVWYRFDGPDEDRGTLCSRTEEGAEPFTRVTSP